MGLGALRKGMMHTEFRASLIRHQRPSLWGEGETEAGAAPSPTQVPPSPSQCPVPPPSPPGRLLPVLLPHSGHQEVPGAGELEAIDEAHLGKGVMAERWSAPHCHGLAFYPTPNSLSPPGPGLSLHTGGRGGRAL